MSLPRHHRQERPRVQREQPWARGEPSRPKRRPNFTAGLFIIAFVAALYFARDFFIPATLALLFALILAPAVHALGRYRIPAAGGAAIVLVAFLGLVALGGYFLAGPISTWAERGPETVQRLSEKFNSMMRPVRDLKAASENVKAKNPEPQPQQVEVKKPGMLKSVVARTGAFVSLAGTTFLLLYFLLAYGDALLTAILASIGNMARRERALSIGHEIKRHISKYLFAITAINLVEGSMIALGLAFAGMPTPMLWGAMHAFLNFIPYLGALTGLAITSAVSFISFDSLSRAIIPPIIYVAVMIMDNFLSPMVLGKRLVLNPALLFLALMFWGWLWGIVGIFIAVPLLLALKILCDFVPNLNRYGQILSARNS